MESRLILSGFNRGPNTVVEDKRRPVFFIRSEFEKLVEAELECGEGPEPTKPAEPELLKPKARPTPESHQWKRAERYIKKHYPNGTAGVSSSVIHRKLEKDKELQAELEKEGCPWGVPSPATINRVLGRRK